MAVFLLHISDIKKRGPLPIGAKPAEWEEAFGGEKLGERDPLSLSFNASVLSSSSTHFLVFDDHALPSSMAFSDDSRRQSLIPSFLYSSSQKSLLLEKMLNNRSSSVVSMSSSAASNLDGGSTGKSFMIPAPSEPGKIELHSPAYYAACTVGGILSCGLTHMAVTPLDLVKCNMQV